MNECRCGAATRDDAYLCDKHADELTQALAEVPFLDEQLEISRTRQKAAGGIIDAGEGGVPWDEAASTAQRALHSTLSTWVRFCDEERVRHQSPSIALPADNPAAMSRWLMWRVDALTLHELGPDAWEEITNAAAEARRIVFRKAQPKVYLGACTAVVGGEECGHAIYATKGAETGRCVAPDCRREYPVATSQEALLSELDGRLLTAADVATTATYMSLGVSRDRIRKQINLWHKRGRIVARSTDTQGRPMFNFGEVRKMLEEAYLSDERMGA